MPFQPPLTFRHLHQTYFYSTFYSSSIKLPDPVIQWRMIFLVLLGHMKSRKPSMRLLLLLKINNPNTTLKFDRQDGNIDLHFRQFFFNQVALVLCLKFCCCRKMDDGDFCETNQRLLSRLGSNTSTTSSSNSSTSSTENLNSSISQTDGAGEGDSNRRFSKTS